MDRSSISCCVTASRLSTLLESRFSHGGSGCTSIRRFTSPDNSGSWMPIARHWVEEIQPLKDMDTYWTQYHMIDPQIRRLATQQNDPERLLKAEALSPGASNEAFSNFINAVDRLSQANRDHYTATLNTTQRALTLSFILSLVLFPLAGLLAIGGVWQRLGDF